MFRWCPLLLVVMMGVVACGGGGGGPTGPAAPSSLSYPSAPAYTVGMAIMALTPTVTGSVTAYAVSPALPAGLALNASTGVISGTPTAVTPAATYSVEASNSDGSTTFGLSLLVNAVKPAISVGTAKVAFATGQPASSITPTASGGAVVSWSISPALPTGLGLNVTTGVISGTPTADSPATPYTLTAQNSGGQATASLTLQVTSSVLLQLGHANGISAARLSGSRALSQDGALHWVLWDYGAGTAIADGSATCQTNDCNEDSIAVDLAGSIVVVEAAAALQVFSAIDGSPLASIPATVSWWKLAADGSYICAGNTTALKAWSPSGAVLYSATGDYSQANVFAAPGQIQVAEGPSGPTVIQTISLSSGAASVSPAFQGQFSRWFHDGSHFLTNLARALWVYSSAGAQQELLNLGAQENVVDGTGTWFWTNAAPGNLNIYAVGGAGTPASSYPVTQNEPVLATSGQAIGIFVPSGFSANSPLSVVDLSGAAPAIATYSSLPIGGPSAFAAINGSAWLLGNGEGVTLRGPVAGAPTYFSIGAVRSLAGSNTNVAIATATNEILVINPQTKTIETTIPFNAAKVQISADGTILAALPTPPGPVSVFSLPSVTPIYQWAAAASDITLSASGSVLYQNLAASRQVTATTGGPIMWSDNNPGPPVFLSPDATLIAATNGWPWANAQFPYPGGAATSIYKNGTLTTAVPGWAPAWINNSSLLVSQYMSGADAGGPFFTYTGSASIDSVSGQVTSSVVVPEFYGVQVISPAAIYAANLNTIFALPAGTPIWQSANSIAPIFPPLSDAGFNPGGAAVAGSYVIFPSGTVVLAEPQ